MSELAVKNNTEVAHVDAMGLIGQAIGGGADSGQIDQLIELVKFHDSRESLKAFNKAFTEAQKTFPKILKTKKAHNSNYAPYSEIVTQIRPALEANGLSFRHTISDKENGICVTCVLAHELGHSESTSLIAPPDNSGKKNAIQSIGSSVTYLKRYTLEAVTGVVTTDDDNDGGQYIEKLTTDQLMNIEAKIDETGADKTKFTKYVCSQLKCNSLSEIQSNKYQWVIDSLNQAYKAKVKK